MLVWCKNADQKECGKRGRDVVDGVETGSAFIHLFRVDRLATKTDVNEGTNQTDSFRRRIPNLPASIKIGRHFRIASRVLLSQGSSKRPVLERRSSHDAESLSGLRMGYYQFEEPGTSPKATPPSLREKEPSYESIKPSLVISEDFKSLTASLAESGRTCTRAKFEELCVNYKDLCEAVVEYKLSALTLRSNSTALTLCRGLVTQDLPVVFEALSTWEFRGPEASCANSEVLDCISKSCATALMTLDKLSGQLAKIDGSAQVMEYFNDGRSLKLMGITPVPEEESRVVLDIIQKPVDKDGILRLVDHLGHAIGRLKTKLRSQSVKQGLKVLVEKQDHFRNVFMDFATVAIFFSSIAASTLQFSYASADASSSWAVVNVCWFASLVFSIASATNSFLGAIVYQTPEYLRPSQGLDHRVLQAWFKFCPPTLLAISGVLFLIGICTFTFASSQGVTVQFVTTTLTSANFLALLLMFLLVFTKLIHTVAHPTVTFLRFLFRTAMMPTTHVSIFAAVFWIHTIFVVILFVIHAFVLIPYLVYHRRVPSYKDYSLMNRDVFKRVDVELHRVMNAHWDALRE